MNRYCSIQLKEHTHTQYQSIGLIKYLPSQVPSSSCAIFYPVKCPRMPSHRSKTCNTTNHPGRINYYMHSPSSWPATWICSHTNTLLTVISKAGWKPWHRRWAWGMSRPKTLGRRSWPVPWRMTHSSGFLESFQSARGELLRYYSSLGHRLLCKSRVSAWPLRWRLPLSWPSRPQDGCRQRLVSCDRRLQPYK